MKRQINATVKAHLIRGAFYLLLLLAVCVIPFALAQRNTGNPGTSTNATQLPTTPKHSRAAAAPDALEMPEFPTGVLWNQYDNPATEPPINIGSQDFEPALASLTDQAADDF